jgi:threonine aldolase
MHDKNAAAPQKNFASDNASGASSAVIAALAACNHGQDMPYGNDAISKRLTQKLADVFACDIHVFLVNSGSAANSLGLSLLTPPWGHVLCHSHSHIFNDECGAPEMFNPGSKLITLQGAHSKIDPAALQAKAQQHVGDVHSTQPACVSITQSTEAGTVYTPDELQKIKAICQDANLAMHMDGARFANALVALDCHPADITWRAGVDVLSFGTAKNGTLTAEAVILFNPDRAPQRAIEMAFRRKRSGHLVSKMRFLAAQVEAYLDDDLWRHNARAANTMAHRLAAGLQKLSMVTLLGATETNIIFAKMHPDLTAHLHANGFYFYDDLYGDHIVRLVTSFCTTPEDVDALITCAQDFETAARSK